MLRALHTIVILTLFAGLLAAVSLTVRVGVRELDHAIATNFPKAPTGVQKPPPDEASVGFGHGILRQP